jgi:hypothetical protein
VQADFSWKYTVKKITDFPVFQPGCHLPNSPWPGIILINPGQEEFGKLHPGWGRENRETFFTVYCIIEILHLFRKLDRILSPKRLAISFFSLFEHHFVNLQHYVT